MKPDLDAIRARCEAATPGPWHGAMPTCDHDHDANDPACAIEDPNSAIVANCVEADADVDFIMYARTDVPALLAYVEELMASIGTLDHMLAEERENVDTLRTLVEELTQERDEERMRVRCFEQMLAEAQADVRELRARIAELEARRWNP